MIVRQAANVLEIMEFFAQTRKPATLAEIADHFGWPRSSTFNLLATLSEKGYLYEPRPRAGFYPTPRWLAMARMISEVEPLPPWTHHADRRSLRGDRRDRIDRGAGRRDGGVHRRRRDPRPRSAISRPSATACRSTPPPAAARCCCNIRRKSATPSIARSSSSNTGPSTPISIEAVEIELRNSIARGYCQSFADYSRDLAGAAIPLPIGDRRLSVVVAGPEFRIGPKVPEVAALIARTVDRLRPKTTAA